METNGALANGVGDGLANGGGNGLANAEGDGLANGAVDGLANGAVDELTNGGGDGLANGAVDGLTNGGGDGLANGAGDGLANGGGDGLANGAGDGLANGAGDGLANGAGDGLANGAGDGLANGGHHHDRTPMPLFFFEDPHLTQHVNLRAVDIGNRVSRPVIRFTCPPNHEGFRIHGSCYGILLISSGDRLYACNPFTRRWGRLPPLHVDYDIIGFYVIKSFNDPADFDLEVLLHDRKQSDCTYYLFLLGTELPPLQLRIGGPSDPTEPDLLPVIANGIVPSHEVPPVTILYFLHWLPQPTQSNNNIIMYDIAAQGFNWIPSPSIQVDGEDIAVKGNQLFEINEHLAMTSVSLTRVDVWVLSNITSLWSQLYHIQLPVDVINLNRHYLQASLSHAHVFAVAQDRNGLVQCPRVLMQCDALGRVLNRYQLAGHLTVLSGHTIEENLRLDPSILPMRDIDAVGDDPPFFQNH